VIEARNGVEGLDLFSQAGADLVITDILMPHKGGLGVVTALRERVPPVNIIAISGAGDSAEDYLDLARLSHGGGEGASQTVYGRGSDRGGRRVAAGRPLARCRWMGRGPAHSQGGISQTPGSTG
jgi:hypothetical protein